MSVFKLEIFWQTRQRQSLAPPSVASSIFSEIRSSSSRERKGSGGLIQFLLVIFSFCIIMHSINVVPESISCFGVFSTQVTRNTGKFNVCWLDVARHVILAGHHLSTGETLPHLVSHIVFNLAHQGVDLRVQFFQCSVAPCKTLTLDHILLTTLKKAIKEQSFSDPYVRWQCGFSARSLSWRVFHRGGNRRQGTQCVLIQCALTCQSCGSLSCHKRRTPILFDKARWSSFAWDHWSLRQLLRWFCRSLQKLFL